MGIGVLKYVQRGLEGYWMMRNGCRVMCKRHWKGAELCAEGIVSVPNDVQKALEVY